MSLIDALRARVFSMGIFFTPLLLGMLYYLQLSLWVITIEKGD